MFDGGSLLGFTWGGPEPVLKEYGGRGGNLVNATAAGTEVIIEPYGYDDEFGKAFKSICKEDGKLHVSAFAPGGAPFRFREISAAGLKRTLSGRAIGYFKKPIIECDLTVIGNSVDHYRLNNIYHLYLAGKKSGSRSYDNEFSSGEGYLDEAVALLKMTIVSHSAPGMNVSAEYGVMTDGTPLFSIDGNRIGDATFSFQFGSVGTPSETKQLYGGDRLATYLGIGDPFDI